VSRTAPSLETKLAATLLALGHIPYEDAKQMTARQITSLYHFDHYPIRHTDGGPSEPWNLVPRLIAAHREKTAKVDQPAIAKDRNIGTAAAIHAAKMASKVGDYTAAARILATAPKPPKVKRKMQSRGFDKGHRPMRQFGSRA
jgi:hypothetical protein